MSYPNKFLNYDGGAGGGVSISQLNSWFITKTSDDLTEGNVNLYITTSQKNLLNSLVNLSGLVATSNPSGNTLASRDGNGSCSFFNISANSIDTSTITNTFDIAMVSNGLIDPAISFKDSAGGDGYLITTDRNQNIANMYIQNTNNSGHLHIQAKNKVVINTNHGGSTQYFNFDVSGNFDMSGTLNSRKLIIRGDTGAEQARIGLTNMYMSFNGFSGTALYQTAVCVSGAVFGFGTATDNQLQIYTNNSERANFQTYGMNINVSSSVITPDESRSCLNLTNKFRTGGGSKSVGMKFWLSDTDGGEKNIGHIYVKSSDNNVVNGDLVLASSINNYTTTPMITLNGSDGKVDIREINCSGLTFSLSGFSTTGNISGRFIQASGCFINKMEGNSLRVNGTTTNIEDVLVGGSIGGIGDAFGVSRLKVGNFPATDFITIRTGLQNSVNSITMLTPNLYFGDSSENLFYHIDTSGIMRSQGCLSLKDLSGDVSYFSNSTVGSNFSTYNIAQQGNFTFDPVSPSNDCQLRNVNAGKNVYFINNSGSSWIYHYTLSGGNSPNINDLSGFLRIDNSGIRSSVPITTTKTITTDEYVVEKNKPFWSYWSNTIKTSTGVITYLSNNSGSNFRNISGTPDTNGRANISISGYYDISFDGWVSENITISGITDVSIRLNGTAMDQFRSYLISAVQSYPGSVVMRSIKYFKQGDYLDVNLASGKLHSQGQRFTGVYIGP